MSIAGKPSTQSAVRLRITGVVQGVGFRPFVYRLAQQNNVGGWVLNGEDGVHVLAEASDENLTRFVDAVRNSPPPAAHVASFDVTLVAVAGFDTFEIRKSTSSQLPTVRISPDLAICDDCLRELFDRSNRRFGYPYINCTNCGPRYSIILGLPYDRPRTVMRDWPLCDQCRHEYENPGDRRFHAQPAACAACGPTVRLIGDDVARWGTDAIARTAALLANGAIVAIKGIGGYHLACDASNARTVVAMRERKYRKERPFALMARDLQVARTLIELDADAERLLVSIERPIVLAYAKRSFEGVAPDNRYLGIMLPYTPVHYLLFAAGAPDVLVMTSANRSSEPIAYADNEALESLSEIADAFLVGERPIARRIDDSIVRAVPAGRVVLRRARGIAPQAVAALPKTQPILALGGDLKNALTLVVDGQAFASQHIGDLDHLSAREAFAATVHDLCSMYEVRPGELTIAHDMHPGYQSTEFAASFPGKHVGVQHHRAHIASVLAERGAWDTRVIGFAFDGTGYGDDATIWGGEIFSGSLRGGLNRVAHLRQGFLPGGDAAARFPVQAAAGFLHEIDDVDLRRPPFSFPDRYAQARELVAHRVRAFETTSVGRLFDAVAALVGFTREQSFEGQAAMWLEHLARTSENVDPYSFHIENGQLDYRPVLRKVIHDRITGRSSAEIARAFHGALSLAIVAIANASDAEQVVVSGGVFQNALLMEMVAEQLRERLWFNTNVPPNDGGLSLGQAAYVAIGEMA